MALNSYAKRLYFVSYLLRFIPILNILRDFMLNLLVLDYYVEALVLPFLNAYYPNKSA